MKKLSLLFTALVLSLLATAQQQKSISLDEAIDLSLKASKELKLSYNDIYKAELALKEARERRLPDAKISGSYLRVAQPNVDLKLRLGGGGQSGSGEGEANTQSSVKVDQAAYGIANVSLPLFSGLRIQHGIESAQYLHQAAKLDAEKDRDEVVANTIAAYSNLYKSKIALDLVRENLKEAQQRVQDFSRQEQNGLLPRNDLLKAQLQQSNVELTLLDAENSWKLTNITMSLLLGLPEGTELMPDTASFVHKQDVKAYADWENMALQNRRDLQALGYRKKAADAGVAAAKGEYYPSLALSGGYVAAYIPNFITITNAVNGGVGLSYAPSSLWKAGTKVAEAKARVNEVTLNQDLMTDAVRLQVAQAYQSYLSSEKKIDVYAKAVEQADENYRIVNNKYTNALSTATDLLDADVARLQAKLNYAYAKADATVAYRKLQQSAGTLSEK